MVDPTLKERLMRVLEAYGAAPDRWPEADRASLQRLLGEARRDPQLRRLIAEAEALDRLLDRMPAPEIPATAIARMAAAAGNPAPAGKAGAAAPVDLAEVRRARGATSPSRWVWSAAASLAASFALGLYLGTTGIADTVIASLDPAYEIDEAGLDDDLPDLLDPADLTDGDAT